MVARGITLDYGQDCVLLLDEDHDGTLLFKDGTSKRLGMMCLTATQPESLGYMDYTAYPNGLYLYVPRDAQDSHLKAA